MDDFTNNSEPYKPTINSKAFIRDLLFCNIVVYDTKRIIIDSMQRARRLHPISANDTKNGSVVSTYETTFVTPENIKVKHVVNPLRFYKQDGKDVAKTLSRDMAINDTFQIQEDQISRKEEKMCIEAVTHDSKKVSKFGEIMEALTHFQDRSGFPANVMVCGPDAWSRFIAKPIMADLLAKMKQEKTNAVEQTYQQRQHVIAPNARLVATGIMGIDMVYVYQDFYTDEDGIVRDMIPPDAIILANTSNVPGASLYGAIEHRGSLIPVARLTTMADVTDPSGIVAQTISAPHMALVFPTGVTCLRIS